MTREHLNLQIWTLGACCGQLVGGGGKRVLVGHEVGQWPISGDELDFADGVDAGNLTAGLSFHSVLEVAESDNNEFELGFTRELRRRGRERGQLARVGGWYYRF